MEFYFLAFLNNMITYLHIHKIDNSLLSLFLNLIKLYHAIILAQLALYSMLCFKNSSMLNNVATINFSQPNYIPMCEYI